MRGRVEGQHGRGLLCFLWRRRDGEFGLARWTIDPASAPLRGRQNVLAASRTVEFELGFGCHDIYPHSELLIRCHLDNIRWPKSQILFRKNRPTRILHNFARLTHEHVINGSATLQNQLHTRRTRSCFAKLAGLG